MKKKIIYSSVLTALLSASSMALAGGPEIIPEPDYFSGFYIGGIGGVHHTTFSGNSQVELTEPVALFNLIPIVPEGIVNSINIGGGDYAGFGGVQGGFGQVMNHSFYVGLQGWGEWGSSSETDTESRSIPFAPVTIRRFTFLTTAAASSTTTMKINNDYGLAGKFGWVVAPRSMIYGKIGASWADIQVSNSVATASSFNVGTVAAPTIFNISTVTGASSSQTDTKIGLLLGIGFEQFVYQDVVSINVEADYTNYGHVNTTPSAVTGNRTVTIPGLGPNGFVGNFPFSTNFFTSASASAQVSSLMAGLNFYFGRNWF